MQSMKGATQLLAGMNRQMNLPALQRIQACWGGGLICVLRHGARARVAHIASFAVRSGCKDNVVVVARRVSGRAHMECLSGRQVMWLWAMRGLGRLHRPAAILQAHSLIAEQQAQWSAI